MGKLYSRGKKIKKKIFLLKSILYKKKIERSPFLCPQTNGIVILKSFSLTNCLKKQ